MLEKKKIQIPFDEQGNQMHHPYDFGCFKEYRDNYEFFSTLAFSCFCRGRSAAYAKFKNTSGMICTMFLKDLEEAIPYMKNGVITGLFTFVKRGQNYGVRLVKSDS